MKLGDMNVRSIDSSPLFEEPTQRPRRMRRQPINIQDSFLFGSLKEGDTLAFALVSGKAVQGRIKRFDRYVVLVETGSQEVMIYKHAIVGITGGLPSAERQPEPI